MRCNAILILAAIGALLGLAPRVPAEPAPVRKLYVDNTGGNTVSVIDLAARKVSHEITVGMHPHGLGVSPDHRHLYVSVEDNHTVAVIDTATDRVIRTIPTTGRPNQLARATPMSSRRSRSARSCSVACCWYARSASGPAT